MPPRFDAFPSSWSRELSADHSTPSPGKSSLTQRMARAAEPPRPSAYDAAAAAVQRKQQDHDAAAAMGFLGGPAGSVDDSISAHAAAGVAGAGQALPHLDTIQAAFGPHDVSGVRAHVGGAAAEASDAIGAHAYATGNDVAFAAQPDLFLAAHEAAHVVQQRQGVSLKSAVGEAGDAYEQHADAVAAAVVRGESAADLLGPTGGAATPAVQRKGKTVWMPGATVETEWFLDYDSVLGTSKKRPPSRSKDTAAVLDTLVLRNEADSASGVELKGGNWAPSGRARIGKADLPLGPAEASGTVSFPASKALAVEVSVDGKGASKKLQGIAMAAVRAETAPKGGDLPEGELAVLEQVAADAVRAAATAGAAVVVKVKPHGGKGVRTEPLPTATFAVDGAGKYKIDLDLVTKEHSDSFSSTSGVEDDTRKSNGWSGSIGTEASVTMTQEEAKIITTSLETKLATEMSKVWSRAVNDVNLTETHDLKTTTDSTTWTTQAGLGGEGKGAIAAATAPQATGWWQTIKNGARWVKNTGVELVRSGIDAIGLNASIEHSGTEGTDTTTGTVKTTGTETTISNETALSFAAELTKGIMASWETRRSTAISLGGSAEAGVEGGHESGHKDLTSTSYSTSTLVFDTMSPTMTIVELGGGVPKAEPEK